MMDSYAYLHLALSHENPPHFHLANPMGIRWKKLSTRAYRGFLSLAVTLAVLSLAQAAQALVAIGDFGSEVTRIQNRLSELGYFTSNTTGYFGDITQNAVIQFQRDNGLVQDGIVGPNTLAVLFGTTSPSDPTPPVSDRDLIGLGFGDSGPGVRTLQNRLRSLGYFTANSTGYFGRITRSAVIRFQQDNFIPATGLVSEETLALLNQRPVTLPSNISLGFGSTGLVVGFVQRQLQQAGFYNGPITHVFDQGTARAVRSFQIAYGLPPTGRVEGTTQTFLGNWGWGVVVPGTPSVPSFPSNPPNSSTVLFVGSRGTAVVLLQQRLQQLGYYTGTVDGIFDESTRRAVIRFQRAYGIEPTGQVGPTTQFYLVRVLARPTIVSPIPQVPAVAVRPAVTPSVSLTVGDTGTGVRRIQRRLRELNFYDGPIDGFFDGDTQMAVMRFQQAYNITTTGIVGPTTEAYLFNSNRRIFSYITPSVAATSSAAAETPVEPQSGAIAASAAAETPVDAKSETIASSGSANVKSGAIASSGSANVKSGAIASSDSANAKSGAIASSDSANAKSGAIASSDSANAKSGAIASSGFTKIQVDAKSGAVASSGSANVKSGAIASSGFTKIQVDAKSGAIASSGSSNTQADVKSGAIAASAAAETPVEPQSGAIAASAAAETPVNVAALQERLKIQGLYSGPINGLYDALTQSAVAKAKELYGASAEAVLYSGL